MAKELKTTFRIASFGMVEGIGGFWIADQEAVQSGAQADGFFFKGKTTSPLFDAIRTPSVAYCIALRLQDGQRAYGDCMTVANLGLGGRPDPLRLDALPALRRKLHEKFEGATFHGFRDACALLDDWPEDLGGRPVAYGLSQAFLSAAALSSGMTPADVLRHEYGIDQVYERPGFAASCGLDWYKNADKAIARNVAMLPHAAMQTADECQRLPEYCSWIVDRIGQIGADGYRPDLHFDFHASLGRLLGNDEDKVLDFLADVTRRAKGYTVYFEDPLFAQNAQEAAERAASLRRRLEQSGLDCRLIADEWANAPGEMELFTRGQAVHGIQIKVPDNGSLTTTIDALRLCQKDKVLAYLGGSCNETDISVRTTVHVGLAFGAWRLFTKPGLGIDEGLMILTNELNRAEAGL
jgi:methylaspartate ammonia-lyase